jgi:site-specific recombinase XerD
MKTLTKTIAVADKNSSHIILPPVLALEQVVREVLERDIAENTRQAFMYDLKNFLGWYEAVNQESFDFQRVTKLDVLDFKQSKLKEGVVPNSLNRYISTLKIFFRTAHELGFIATDLGKALKSVSKPALAPKALTESEARAIMREVEIRENKRDKLIISLMLYAGLRKSEVTSLNHNDLKITPRGGLVTIKHSKGNKTREVPLNLKLRGIIAEFYEAYGERTNPNIKIFKGQRGDLKDSAVSVIFSKYASKAGVAATVHSCRHYFAFQFLKHNPSELVALSQLLGHSNIQTTTIYTQSGMADLAEKMENMI